MEQKDITTNSQEAESKSEYAQGSEAEVLETAKREDRNTMPYISASSCNPIGALVPTKLAYETIESLNRFIGKGIDTAELVREKLGYKSKIDVCSAFAAEQVDAIALAIVQIERGKGFILGDMAGIGKGRVVAGICRYAKREGKVPIFSTIGANLFTDIYRDFNDIGGLTGSPMMAGSRNNIDLPVPFILNTDKSGIINQEIGEEVVELFKPFSPKDTKDFCDLKNMPLNTDIVLMTYSQLNQDVENAKNGNAISKFNFLKAIAPNSILVLDESHKGAGDGNIGENLTELIALSSGVMFASATYSKVPKSMMLYIPKTDIKESRIRPSTIVDAVSENGEAVQEYIASLLVKGGQMIRRERTFDNCKIDYNYMKADVQKYYGLYDKVMNLYNEIEAFSKSTLYKEAVEKAIERIANENKVTLVGKDNPKPSRKDEKNEWMEDNKTKYQPFFNPTNLVKSRFQWIENLLFSIKADYVAQETINLLNSREVRNEDGHLVPNYVEYTIGTKKEKVLTNFKPIICVRNTAESSMNGLGYTVGRRLTKEENDYAKTLVNIAQSLMSSKMTFKPVNESRKPIVIEKADILNEDFTDNGVRVAEIIRKMNEATSGLPLSPIDAMIEKIQSVKRQNWDDKYSSSEYYVVEEITKRSKKIVSTTDGGFEIVPVKKEAVTNKTSRFNSGKSDVVILNTSGSTGISMHSKWDFIDRRPRVMLIHQVELDVATEVQKRGRVNRTGQVNNPAYSYVVSAIPSEVRKLMMLRRKLRSLDANTTGNVKQSAKASQILDKEGNEIEDMSNKYGYECLMDFVKEAGNERFYGLVANEWYEDAKSPEDKFETYLREVEKLPCADQEDFYNRMNSNYIKLKNRLIEADEWDLDTTIEDLKTSTLNKKILYQGNDDNEFTKSVYIEDKYITPKGKPYTKEELEDRIIELAKTKDLTKYHNDLLDEFDAYMSAEIDKMVLSLGDADISNATTEEEKVEIIEAHKEMVNNATIEARYKFDSVRRRLIYFKPNKIVQYPLNTDLLYLGAFDQNGNRIPVSYDGGKFVGFKFLSKSDNKFSKMNIELHFASTSRSKPHLKVTLTKQYEGILDWIMNPSGHGGKILTDEQLARVNNWTLASRGERDRMRIFTGELFKSFEMADDIFKVDGNYEKKKRLIKYTTTAGTVETGIKLWQKRFIPLTEGTTPLFTSVNSTAFKNKINDLSSGRTALLPSMNEFFTKNYNGTMFFCVCTGKTTPKAKRIDKVYLSKISDPTILEELYKEIGVSPFTKEFNIEMYSSGSAEKFRAIEFKVFELNPTRLEKLLIYLDRKFGFLVQVNTEGAESEFIVRDLPDMFDAKAKEGEEEGVFDYYLTTTFDDKKLPPNYIDGSFKETPENDYGMVSLRYPLNIVEASIHKVFPANITKSQAVKNILNAIKDDESRLKFIEDVKALGEEYGVISELAQQVVGINPRYAIGKVGLKYAGKVISDYIKNPVEDEAKIEVQEIEEKTPLDFDSAQDFIIKLKSLL